MQALHDQIDQVAGQITWYDAEVARENRLSDLITAIESANDSISRGVKPDWGTLDNTWSNIVGQGKNQDAFWRYYIDSQTDGASLGDPNGNFAFSWKTLISYTPSDLQYDNGFVYDWRLGVPAVTQLIALRIQLMALEDINFAHDGGFFLELQDDRNALRQHVATMLGGIRCNAVVNPPFQPPPDAPENPYPDYTVDLACADIYSGLNDTRLLDFPNAYPLSLSRCIVDDNYDYDQSCLNQRQIDYQNWYAANVQAQQDDAYRNVRNLTPWFGVQTMVNTLSLYLDGLYALTAIDNHIRPAANSSLCLDLPNVVPLPGTYVILAPCSGGFPSQYWTYDHSSQSITNFSSGYCLDVRGANTAPQTPVQIYPCNNTPAQRWTWDPEGQVLTNMLGNVLDVPNANFSSGQYLWTYGANNSNAQQWLSTSLGDPQHVVTGYFSHTGSLDVFYIQGASPIQYNWQQATASNWYGNNPLGGSALQLAVGTNYDQRLELFYVGTNNNLYHNWEQSSSQNNSWSGENLLPGVTFAKQLAVANNSSGDIEVYYIGTGDQVYRNYQRAHNGTWSGEIPLGGSASKELAVAANGDNRLEVFYIGMDGTLMHNWQVWGSTAWSGETAFGGLAKHLVVGKNVGGIPSFNRSSGRMVVCLMTIRHGSVELRSGIGRHWGDA